MLEITGQFGDKIYSRIDGKSAVDAVVVKLVLIKETPTLRPHISSERKSFLVRLENTPFLTRWPIPVL